MEINERDFKELIDELRIYNSKLGQGVDSDTSFKVATDRMVMAMSVLGTKIDGSSSNKRKQDKSIEEFNKTVDKSIDKKKEENKVVEQSTIATKDDTKATTESIKAKKTYKDLEKEYHEIRKKITGQDNEYFDKNRERIDQVKNEARAIKDSEAARKSSSVAWFDNVKQSTDGFDILKNGFFNLAGNSKLAQVGLQGVAAVAEGLIAGFKSFSSSIYKGERGAAVAAKALEDTAKPALDLADSLSNFGMALGAAMMFINPIGGIAMLVAGGLGKVAVAAGKAYLELNKLGAEQVDKLLKSFNQLSKSGGSVSGGLDTVFGQAQKLGYSMSQLEEYNTLMTKGAKDFKLFGATMTDGRNKFAEVAGDLYKSGLGYNLELLGQTAEDQRESTLAYMDIQSRLGKSQLMTNKQLTEGAYEFAKQLDIAATITGASVEEQKQVLELQKADERLRAAEIYARETNNKTMMDQIAVAKMASQATYAAGDKKAATGFLHLGASGGVATTPEAIAAMMQYQASNMFNKNGPKTQGEVQEYLAKGARSTNTSLMGINRFVGGVGGVQSDLIAADNLQRRQKLIADEAKKQGFLKKDGTIDTDKFAASEQGKKFEATPEMQNLIRAVRTQQSAGMIMDSGVRQLTDSVAINAAATDTFKAAVDKFAEVVGVKKTINNSPPPALTASQATAAAAANAQAVVANPSSTKQERLNAAQALFKAQQEERNAVNGSNNKPSGRSDAAVPTGGNSTNSSTGGNSTNSSTGGNSTNSPTGELDLSKINPDAVLTFAGDISGWRDNFDRLDSSIKDRVLTAAVEYNKLTGNKMTITSGARTADEQRRVKAQRGVLAAEVGFSKHEANLAVDIGNVDDKVLGALRNAGLKQTVNGEKWHFEKAKTGGIFSGPSSGYLVEMHDDEIVVPANKGVSKQALGTASDALLGGSKDGQDRMVALFEKMIEKYDEMIDLLDSGNDHSKKLVTALA
jgi:hypothetical protein